MICPPSEEEGKNLTKTLQNDPPKRRKNKNKKKKNKSKQNQFPHGIKKDVNRRRNSRFTPGMSSLAENLTVAATWQLKHQLAYWKAKAKALEYENGVLHNIIKKNYSQSSTNSLASTVRSDTEIEEDTPSEDDVAAEDEDFEVSEEFVEFLRANAKYKEDARMERERLKAKQKADEHSEIKNMEAGPSVQVDPTVELKQLYGDKWQRISAMETYLNSKYIEECDKSKPMYWPNIPFNFNFI